jgi:hypothetical protein
MSHVDQQANQQECFSSLYLFPIDFKYNLLKGKLKYLLSFTLIFGIIKRTLKHIKDLKYFIDHKAEYINCIH